MRLIAPVRIRQLRISRVKYILIFVLAGILLTTYLSSIDYEFIFSGTTEIRFIETPGNETLHRIYTEIRPKNVFFLKVHKSASSTVQNILMRYGVKHDLNTVLPYTSNYLGHPMPFDPSMALPLAPGNSYNLFCHHTRFDCQSVLQVMPEDTIFVTIIRSPTQMYESLYSYFDLAEFYQMNLTEFASMPRWWLHTCGRYYGRIGLNQIAFDLGMDESDFPDLIQVRRMIDQTDRSFDLVMIAEYFDESLILLKHLLRLDFEDVVYFSHNQRMGSTRIVLRDEDQRTIAKANHVDQLIYDHFLAVFHQKMADFGELRMRDEVAQLRDLIARWRVMCGIEHVDNGQITELMFRGFSHKVHGIRLTRKTDVPIQDFCENLAKSEMPFTSQLRRSHLEKHGSTWLRFLYAIGYYHV